MTGISTPQTEASEQLPGAMDQDKPSDPLRLPKTNQSSQSNPPIRIPKIETDISFTEDPASLAHGLVGKCVDEFGNILDWDGTVQGRVEGDLPSMIGRAVSKGGKILDTSGEVAGHVSENYINSSTPTEEPSNKRLKIDHTGTIYDHNGAVVGKMKDHSNDSNTTNTNTDTGNSNTSAGCARCQERDKRSDQSHETAAPRAQDDQAGGTTNVPHRTATPSPSEIYLDVKSTHDGIQLIIKIPTVFNRDHDNRR